jgi:hypothetical protein
LRGGGLVRTIAFVKRIAAFPAVLLAAACTTAPIDDVDAATMAETAGSFGLVRIERASGAELATLSAQVRAAFARHRGVDGRGVLELLGERVTDVESCSLAADAPGVGLDGEIELLEAGAIEVSVGGVDVAVRSRAFPELGDVVGGSFYAGEASLAAALGNRDVYDVRGRGARELGAFDVAIVAPPGFAELAADGAPLVAGGASVAIDRFSDVDVTWDGGDPADRVEIEITSGRDVLVCVAADDGAFTIGSPDLLGLAGDPAARLVARRVRSQPFDIDGVERAWASVAATYAAPVALR